MKAAAVLAGRMSNFDAMMADAKLPGAFDNPPHDPADGELQDEPDSEEEEDEGELDNECWFGGELAVCEYNCEPLSRLSHPQAIRGAKFKSEASAPLSETALRAQGGTSW